MRIAALDLGSNSFHLVVVEARLDRTFSTVVREKEVLRLGDLVARTGRIGPEAAQRALEVLVRFRALSVAHRADELVALGTSALREALDGDEFVERARAEAGVDIEVVDGVREARLIFSAIRSSVLIEPAPALAADLGGGSLELMVGDQAELAFAASLRLGVGRLTAELVRDDPPSREDLGRIGRRVSSELAPVLAEVAVHKPRMLIGSSGTFLAIARMAVARREGTQPETLNQLRVARRDIAALAEVALALPSAARARLAGCDARRAELIPAGLVVLDALMESTGLEELTLSEWALREGIVLEAIGAHDRADLANDPRAIRRASLLSLCRRSSWRQPHARQVAALALELFDQMGEIHRLGGEDRELLELAALAHDIGEHVSRTDHDRHGAYLLENGGLRGFSPAEIQVLSSVVRFHVRGTPKPHHDAFAQLEEADRLRVAKLVALLRVADALEATHAGTVEHVAVEATRPDAGHCTLVVRAHSDVELELWTLRRKKELFERTFGIELRARVERVGPSGFEPSAAGTSGFG